MLDNSRVLRTAVIVALGAGIVVAASLAVGGFLGVESRSIDAFEPVRMAELAHVFGFCLERRGDDAMRGSWRSIVAPYVGGRSAMGRIEGKWNWHLEVWSLDSGNEHRFAIRGRNYELMAFQDGSYVVNRLAGRDQTWNAKETRPVRSGRWMKSAIRGTQHINKDDGD